MKTTDSLSKKITPIVEGLGCQLWGVQSLPQGGRTLLRIYIEKLGGANAGDCQKIGRQLGALFNVESPVAGEYTLEVSTPGMDRMLFTLAQYEQCLGQKVHVRLAHAQDGVRQLRGQLVKVDAPQNRIDVLLSEGQSVVSVALDDIQQTRVIPEWR